MRYLKCVSLCSGLDVLFYFLFLCYVVRSDMSSLTDTAQGAQPMNLHSRVIQSGLDSITGPDANSIVLLFTGCALFAEVRSLQVIQQNDCHLIFLLVTKDQVIPAPILNIVWLSINSSHSLLSAIKLRNWVTALLHRSILLGSIQQGLNMHDVKS